MHASDRSEVFRDRSEVFRDRSEVFRVSRSTASKRRHMARCCVCMQVNETGHAQRAYGMLKQRLRKWFFPEEVDFLPTP